MFETEAVGPCFVQKLRWGGGTGWAGKLGGIAPCLPPSGNAPGNDTSFENLKCPVQIY